MDTGLAQQQAERLYKAGVGKLGTNEDEFIAILTTANRAQIQKIKDCYEKTYNMSLKKVCIGFRVT